MSKRTRGGKERVNQTGGGVSEGDEKNFLKRPFTEEGVASGDRRQDGVR